MFAYLTVKPISPHVNGAFLCLGWKEAALLCLCNMKQAGKMAAFLVRTQMMKWNKSITEKIFFISTLTTLTNNRWNILYFVDFWDSKLIIRFRI